MKLYTENPKDATRKLLKLIGELAKVAGYNINAQKFLALLYTNNKRLEKEIKETILFTIASKRIKYWQKNLWEEAKNLYWENYKTLMKEIKDNTKRWRDNYTLGLKESTLLKGLLLLKAVYRI